MAKRQCYSDGKYTAATVTYSSDHRHWGNDLQYCDVDGIEWAEINRRWYPVALIEECDASRTVDRDWQLSRYAELAGALSQAYGYTIHAFWVRWTANPTLPEGERVQTLDVMCVTSGTRKVFDRLQWVEFLRGLRRKVRARLSTFATVD